MANFRFSFLLCLAVLVAGLVVDSAWAVDSDSEADYQAWMAAHKAQYDAKQALVSQQSTTTLSDSSPPPPPPASSSASCYTTVGPKGSGAKYHKVKDAVKSIPSGSTGQRYVICFAAGTYT